MRFHQPVWRATISRRNDLSAIVIGKYRARHGVRFVSCNSSHHDSNHSTVRVQGASVVRGYPEIR